MKILGLNIKIKITRVADEPPQAGHRYFHKSNDPEDMVKYVIVNEIIDNGIVKYRKIYKSEYQMDPQMDQCSVREFNKWYKSR